MDNTAVVRYVRIQMIIASWYVAVCHNTLTHGHTQKCDERGVWICSSIYLSRVEISSWVKRGIDF